MDNDSVLYILMDMRVNGVLDRILERDGEYQEIIQKSGEYSEKLDAMHLPPEVMDLIDHYVSEQNALGARYGALAYKCLCQHIRIAVCSQAGRNH